MAFNPAAAVSKKHRHGRRAKPQQVKPRRALTPDEAKRLLRAAYEARTAVPKRKGGERPDYYAILLLDLDTGLRRSEFLGLRWQDVDLKTGALILRGRLLQPQGSKPTLVASTKGGEEARPILLSRVVVDELKAERARQAKRRLKARGWNPLGVVFPGKDGGWRRPDTVTHHVADLLRAAEIEGVDLHSLRHTEITWLRDADVDPLTIRDRSGHTEVHMTEAYMHAALETQRPAADALQDILASVLPEK
jgi:integrase